MSSTIDFSRGTWREPPAPVRVLTVCGWLTGAEANDPNLRIESLSSSHSVFRAIAPDGRSVVVKQVPRKAWESGRSLVRELYVYRLGAWIQELSNILPKALLIDERNQTLVVEWIDKCHLSPTNGAEVGLISPDVSTRLGRTMATWHRVTAGISLVPALSNGILHLPEHRETASEGRSQATQIFMRKIFGDRELCSALRDGQSMYRYKCLVHGDIRSDNWLIPNSGSSSGIKIIDWELSGAGDPAWDLGSACAELIVSGMRLGTTMDKGASGWPIVLEPALKQLVAAYSASGGLLARDDGSEWDRVVLYTVGRLLHVGCEWADFATTSDIGPMQSILKEARALLRRRNTASASLVQWANA